MFLLRLAANATHSRPPGARRIGQALGQLPRGASVLAIEADPASRLSSPQGTQTQNRISHPLNPNAGRKTPFQSSWSRLHEPRAVAPAQDHPSEGRTRRRTFLSPAPRSPRPSGKGRISSRRSDLEIIRRSAAFRGFDPDDQSSPFFRIMSEPASRSCGGLLVVFHSRTEPSIQMGAPGVAERRGAEEQRSGEGEDRAHEGDAKRPKDDPTAEGIVMRRGGTHPVLDSAHAASTRVWWFDSRLDGPPPSGSARPASLCLSANRSGGGPRASCCLRPGPPRRQGGGTSLLSS